MRAVFRCLVEWTNAIFFSFHRRTYSFQFPISVNRQKLCSVIVFWKSDWNCTIHLFFISIKRCYLNSRVIRRTLQADWPHFRYQMQFDIIYSVREIRDGEERMKVWVEAEYARITQWWTKKCIQLWAIRTAFSKCMININERAVAIFTIHLINLICWAWMSNIKPLFISSTEWSFRTYHKMKNSPSCQIANQNVFFSRKNKNRSISFHSIYTDDIYYV